MPEVERDVPRVSQLYRGCTEVVLDLYRAKSRYKFSLYYMAQ
jgi:hypothetical protein